MTEAEKIILEKFAEAIPSLSQIDRERLLAFCEGVIYASSVHRNAQ